jgi:phage tail-like protein
MNPTFLVLDAGTGWSIHPDLPPQGLAFVDDSWSLASDLSAPPSGPARWEAWLAWSPASRSWWLGGRFGLRVLRPCDDSFTATSITRPVRAVAVGGGFVAALLGRSRGTVVILDEVTGHQVGEARVGSAIGLVAVAGGCGVGVVDACRRIVELEPSGLACGTDPGPAPDGPWLPDGVGLRADGFVIAGRGAFDRSGRPVADDGQDADGRPALQTTGTFHSAALDSGLHGCRWHRLRLDVDAEPGTTINVAVATTDAEPGPGVPDPGDWYDAGPGVDDIQLPDAPGRWAYIRVTLTGDGRATPRLHRIRLDLPRNGPADLLPGPYAEDPRARDFTERFVGLLGAFVDQVDEAIARRPALLDADALPDDALGWLAGTLGLGFEPEMPAARRRALVAAAPDLYRRRGTPHALVDTLRIALGVTAVVDEPGTNRPWGAVGTARLGGVRLFGSATARVRLGASRLGGARLVSGGDPDLDAVHADAHRVRVLVGSVDDEGRRVDPALVARVARSQTPANVAVTVVTARPGAAVGGQRVGIDTVLLAPEPAVVGSAGLGRGARVVSRRTAALAVVGGQRVSDRPCHAVPHRRATTTRPSRTSMNGVSHEHRSP